MTRLVTRYTWIYVLSLIEIAVAVDLLVVGWANKEYLTLVVPFALASVGVAASIWRKTGAIIGTALTCALLLTWRVGHTNELTVADLAGATLYCVTALVLGLLAMRRRWLEDRLVSHEAELEVALETEAALSRSKDEFLRLVAHELRNPVAVLVGSSDMLVKRKVTGLEQDEVVHDISLEARRVHHLIEDLLSLARFDEGLKSDPEPLLVGRIAQSAVQEFHERYPHPVTLSVDESLPLALGSRVQVERVLSNLLSNAGKYSPKASTISVESKSLDDSLEIDVLDRGPGVPAGDTEHIFDAFERLSSSEEARGYGLGLAISKRLVEANDGRIWAKNREGGGLDVGFSLPLYRE